MVQPHFITPKLNGISRMAESLLNPSLAPITNQNPELNALIVSAHDALMKCMRSINEVVPILRLPGDVVDLIFMTLRDMTDQPQVLQVAPYTPSPLVVSHVCTAWRAAALSSPLLWTSLDISVPWKIYVVHLFLTRSQSCPIDLKLTATSPAHGAKDLLIKAVSLCFMLGSHLSRCRRIHIEVDDGFQPIITAFRDHFIRFPTSLPLLQELHLEGCPDMHANEDIGPLSACIFPQGLPSLITARIGICAILPSYRQLTSLHLDTTLITAVEFCRILSRCQALETLAIYEPFKDVVEWPDDDEPPPFSLPSLSSLQFYDHDESTITSLLLLIAAPRLHQLVIARFFPDDLAKLSEHLDDGNHNCREVKSLTLALDDRRDWEELVGGVELASQCFPRVEEATFVGEMASAALAVLQAEQENRDIAWPRLHTLALRSPVNTIQELVAFRESVGSPLRTIYLSPEALADQANLPWLKTQLEVIEFDVWDNFRRDGLYHSYRTYGTEVEIVVTNDFP